uniref:BTB domain-containing protein n=1 Tax=Caenorhabditis tropicalis TaxID=1561998 RepID=A0A1I7TGS7_9PELO
MSSGNQIVKLDIGGTVFKTSKSTLTRFDGMLKVMMETDIPVTKDESGAIFIDRSPKHFELILNFMRDGDVELPDSEKEIKEIQKEADFYLLHDLAELCQETSLKKLRHIKSDDEWFDVIGDPSKPVLIINHPEEPSDGFRECHTDILRFAKNNEHNLNIYFKSYKWIEGMGSDWSWDLYKNFKRLSMPYETQRDFNLFVSTLEKSIEELDSE